MRVYRVLKFSIVNAFASVISHPLCCTDFVILVLIVIISIVVILIVIEVKRHGSWIFCLLCETVSVVFVFR